jgi:hypothetical protein
VAWQDKFDVVFRAKAQGKSLPRIGMPATVQPGDQLTFFLDGAFHTRVVKSMHGSHAVVEALTSPYGKLDDERKVKFDDFYDAWRPKEPKPEPPPKPKPEPKPKRAKKKKPPPSLMEFLDSAYQDD